MNAVNDARFCFSSTFCMCLASLKLSSRCKYASISGSVNRRKSCSQYCLKDCCMFIVHDFCLFVNCRYAIEVNLERAEDVLTHKRLLHLARDPENRPAFEVRLVQVSCCYGDLNLSLNMFGTILHVCAYTNGSIA